MAVDISKNLFDLFSGTRRTRLIPTLAIAVVVTAAVVVPLAVRAKDARDNPPERTVVLAPSTGVVMVDTADAEPRPLDGAVVDGSILVSLDHDQALAASFRLFAAGSDEPIIESQDLEGPPFDMITSATGGSPFDTTVLENGPYELFVSVRAPAEDQRVAVGFDVANP